MLSSSCVPGSAVGTRDTVNETDKVPALGKLLLLMGRQMIHLCVNSGPKSSAGKSRRIRELRNAGRVRIGFYRGGQRS